MNLTRYLAYSKRTVYKNADIRYHTYIHYLFGVFLKSCDKNIYIYIYIYIYIIDSLIDFDV